MEGASDFQTSHTETLAPIPISADTKFYESIPADPRPGAEYRKFKNEGVIPTRLEHIQTHMIDLKQKLGVQDLEEGLQRLAEIAQETDPSTVRQFEARKGRVFKYHIPTQMFMVIQKEARGQEKLPPPPPPYIITAYALSREEKFEQKRLENQKGLPKFASAVAVAGVQ
jgi:hypothetical protein